MGKEWWIWDTNISVRGVSASPTPVTTSATKPEGSTPFLYKAIIDAVVAGVRIAKTMSVEAITTKNNENISIEVRLEKTELQRTLIAIEMP
ncbi:MAG: hypothetical protein OWQ48_03220 [Desulfurococcus sp.]|nr:hypothetical protein [Desulfurococcus sp.]